MAGMLHPFDPSVNKPRPNPDGSVSTELTRTVQLGGQWVNVPSLWWGAGSDVRDFGPMSDDQLAEFAGRYEAQTGQKFPRFPDLPTAESAAQGRSKAGGGEAGSIAAAPAPVPALAPAPTPTSTGRGVTLNINGKRVKVDDSFLSLTPEQQNATVDEIAAGMSVQAQPKADFGPKISPDPNFNPMAAEPVQNPETGYSPSSVPWMDPITAGANAAVDSVPFVGAPLMSAVNWLDANANPLALMLPKDAPQDTPERRAEIAQSQRDEFPIASAAGSVGGTVAALGPLAATKTGQLAFGLTGPLLRRLGAGFASGGLLGFGDQMVRSGGDVNKSLDAGLWSGAFGAAGGAAAPVVDDAVRAVMRRFGLGAKEGAESLSRPSREVLGRLLSGSDALGEKGVANIRAAGPDAMFVDASAAAPDLLDTVIQRSGPAALGAKQGVEARAANANALINQSLDETLGAPRGVKAMETGLRKGSAAARGDAYETAYSMPIDYSAEAGRNIEDLLKRVPGDVIALANKMMKGEGAQSAQILAKVADDGTVTYFRMPDVRQLDYITRALNQAARSGEGAGALGGQTDIGRIWGNLARDIRGSVKEAVPEYATALETAAQPIAQRQALLLGQDLLKPSVTRSVAEESLAGLSKPELDYVKAGIRANIDDVLANVRIAVSNPNMDAQQALAAVKMLTTPAARQKLIMVIGEEGAGKLLGQLDQALQSLQLRASVASGSRTFGRSALDQVVNTAVDNGIPGALMRGEPVNATKSIVQALTGATPTGTAAAKDRVYAEIARILMLKNEEAVKMVQSLTAAGKKPIPNAAYLAALPQALNDYAPPVMARP